MFTKSLLLVAAIPSSFWRTSSFLLSHHFQAWIITCIFFVFAALLEYSIILLRIKLYRDESRVSVSSTPFYIPMEMWSIREPPYMTSALEEGIVRRNASQKF